MDCCWTSASLVGLEVKQHGYEHSEKCIEATMRSQSSAQSSTRGETMKRTEKSKANSTQEKSRPNSKQSKLKDCDREKAKHEDKYEEEDTIQSKAVASFFFSPLTLWLWCCLGFSPLAPWLWLRLCFSLTTGFVAVALSLILSGDTLW